MNIGDAGFQFQRLSNQTVRQNQGTTPAQEKAALSGNERMAYAREGQMFSGEVMDVQGEQVTIRMEDNALLSARLGGDVGINIGDELNFLVKEVNGSNVLIKPFAEGAEAMKDNAIFKVLEGNNLTPSAKNYQIAEALMNQSMGVDKGSMQKLIQQSYKFPDVPVDTLVQMNKLNIPVNEANIKQFQAYQENNHQIMQGMRELADSMTDFASKEILSLASGKEGLSFQSDFLATISDPTDMQNILNNAMQELSGGEEAVLPEQGGQAVGAYGLAQAAEEAVLQEGTLAAEQPVAEAGINTTENINVSTNENSLEQTALQEGEVGSLENPAGKETPVSSPDAQNQQISVTTPAQLAEKLALPEQQVTNFVRQLENMGVPKEALSQMAQHSESPLQLLNNANALLNSAIEQGTVDSDKIKEFLLSEDYKGIMGKAIRDKFSLNPNKMHDPAEVKDLYQSLYEKTENLMQRFGASGGSAGEHMQEQAKNMQERIDFMQNLSDMYVYAQLPVRMDGVDHNTDLFVYMNKKRIQEAKEDVSALLHLDMDYLGPTDVHVSLRGSTVHTKFYVEDEKSAQVLDEHMNMLEQAINENGFSLTNEVIMREPTLLGNAPKNPVVDEMLGQSMEQSVKRYSFDVRT